MENAKTFAIIKIWSTRRAEASQISASLNLSNLPENLLNLFELKIKFKKSQKIVLTQYILRQERNHKIYANANIMDELHTHLEHIRNWNINYWKYYCNHGNNSSDNVTGMHINVRGDTLIISNPKDRSNVVHLLAVCIHSMQRFSNVSVHEECIKEKKIHKLFKLLLVVKFLLWSILWSQEHLSKFSA